MFEVLNQSRDELLDDCTVETFRGSGPGGTKADTTESAVRITHEPTGITVSASEQRSQQANRKTAYRRLKLKYALEVRHDVDSERINIPDQLESYLNDGIDINPKNPHFPFWVKLVLDVLKAHQGRVGPTADVFGLSTNQLVRFFRKDDRLWQQANRIREQFDLHPLKSD
ncbi:MAG: peptide chain release factor-like protein [bacterium]